MKIGKPKSLYLRTDSEGRAVLVYEIWVSLEEDEMVPLGADIEKAARNINALKAQNRAMLAQNAALRAKLEEAQAVKGIQTDDETDEVLSQFHDLVASLPDNPAATLPEPTEQQTTSSPEEAAAPVGKPPAGSDQGPHNLVLQ